jgi:sigma-B regulation protein RsbQ
MEANSKDIFRRHNVNILGSGTRAVVFGHGLGLDQNTWRLITPSFTKEYKLVLFDYIGSGKADKGSFSNQKYQSLEGYADDLNELCEQLELSAITFVGHSISSMIGLLASLKKPLIYDKLVFIAPSPRYIDDVDGYVGGYKQEEVDSIIKQIEEDYLGWIKTSVPSIVNQSNPPNLVDEVLKAFMANDKDMLKQFALSSFFIDYRKDLLAFDKPCLIIQSADDVVAPLQVGDYLHAHLTNSKLVRLKGKGHFPQLTSPQEVIKAIRGFMNH